MPWWPGERSPTYHATTSLTNGQGYEPQQLGMQPMTVNGVGSGSQEAKFKMICPIDVPHTDGQSHMHQLTAPIVEGDGADLPGLF